MHLLDTDTLTHLYASHPRVTERLRKQRGLRKMGRADLLVASIALARQATLVTRNLRHFRQVPGLTAVNWVD